MGNTSSTFLSQGIRSFLHPRSLHPRQQKSISDGWVQGDVINSSLFDRTPNAACAIHSKQIGKAIHSSAMTNAENWCQSLCTSFVPRERVRCYAAQYESYSRTCFLYRECLYRRPSPGSVVMHTVGPSYPIRPAQVVWRTNASLVVASYTKTLSWLRTLPLGLLDIVVYNKHDFGKGTLRMTRGHVEGVLKRRLVCGDGRAFNPPAEWVGRGLCPSHCKCPTEQVSELAYFTTLPNYGNSIVAPFGGSRESFVYLQYILDFWHNLPPVVIFTQDDCIHRMCFWARAVPRLSGLLNRWPSVWGGGSPMTSANCFCRLMREHTYSKHKYHWLAIIPNPTRVNPRILPHSGSAQLIQPLLHPLHKRYPYMSFLHARLLNQSMETRSSFLEWPMDANMVVGRTSIRRNSISFYQILHRLTVVENQCVSGSIQWAHAYERLWLNIFDPRVLKVLKLHGGRDVDSRLLDGACLVSWLDDKHKNAVRSWSSVYGAVGP